MSEMNTKLTIFASSFLNWVFLLSSPPRLNMRMQLSPVVIISMEKQRSQYLTCPIVTIKFPVSHSRTDSTFLERHACAGYNRQLYSGR